MHKLSFSCLVSRESDGRWRTAMTASFKNAIGDFVPGREDVRQLVSSLKELCPKMFEGHEFLSQLLTSFHSQDSPPASGRTSPIGVDEHDGL